MDQNRFNIRALYPFDVEEFDTDDSQILRKHKIALSKLFIADYHYESADGKDKARQSGLGYISDLRLRESMKVALECWYEERISSAA